ncbi:MAG: acyl-CoA transferase, partial [Serratia sp.]|nr:acyl-CoA transferase [Serratia sp. (in: enterobacteria)]
MSSEIIREKTRELYAQLTGVESLPAALSVTGEGNLPAYYPVTPLIAASVAVAAQALSHLLSLQHGGADAVTVDRRLASLWCKSSLKPDGWALPPAWDSLAGDY